MSSPEVERSSVISAFREYTLENEQNFVTSSETCDGKYSCNSRRGSTYENAEYNTQGDVITCLEEDSKAKRKENFIEQKVGANKATISATKNGHYSLATKIEVPVYNKSNNTEIKGFFKIDLPSLLSPIGGSYGIVISIV